MLVCAGRAHGKEPATGNHPSDSGGAALWTYAGGPAKLVARGDRAAGSGVDDGRTLVGGDTACPFDAAGSVELCGWVEPSGSRARGSRAGAAAQCRRSRSG